LTIPTKNDAWENNKSLLLLITMEETNKIKGTLVAFVVGQSQISRTAKQVEQLEILRSAPHYFGLIPPQKILGTEEKKIQGKKVDFTIKTYVPDIVIAETRVEFENIFDESNLDFKNALIIACREILLKYKVKKETDEEYSVWCTSDYQGNPDNLMIYGDKIAGFLKSEKLQLDEKEIEKTLKSSIKYAQNDLSIVDWDGAFVFEPQGQFGLMIELFQIANLQLLRYRILDMELDQRMKRVNQMLKESESKKIFSKSREAKQIVRELIAMRSTSVLEFENTERDIKLIGDWYSARLYDLVGKKFHFDEWRQRIKVKLDSIEDIYSMISENFNISLRSRLEYWQLFGWTVLMIGWFVLIIFEFFNLLRQ
jgi:hypothetical protein